MSGLNQSWQHQLLSCLLPSLIQASFPANLSAPFIHSLYPSWGWIPILFCSQVHMYSAVTPQGLAKRDQWLTRKVWFNRPPPLRPPLRFVDRNSRHQFASPARVFPIDLRTYLLSMDVHLQVLEAFRPFHCPEWGRCTTASGCKPHHIFELASM